MKQTIGIKVLLEMLEVNMEQCGSESIRWLVDCNVCGGVVDCYFPVDKLALL